MRSVGKKADISWGLWVHRRAEFLGFKRQSDLSKIVGCSRQQLSNWFAMVAPPISMRKGFDRWLANALQTTHRTLFIDYVNVAPETATVIGYAVHHGQVPIVVSDPQIIPTDPLLREIIPRLEPGEKDDVCEYAIMLVLAKQDTRSMEFRRYLKQLNNEAEWLERGPIEFRTSERAPTQKRRPKREGKAPPL
jgi:hypothetical protein